MRKLTDREKKATKLLLGARCAIARTRLGLSQRELARRMDKSASWIRECESGAQWCPWWLVIALAEASGRPIGWFIGETGLTEQKRTAGSLAWRLITDALMRLRAIKGGVQSVETLWPSEGWLVEAQYHLECLGHGPIPSE